VEIGPTSKEHIAIYHQAPQASFASSLGPQDLDDQVCLRMGMLHPFRLSDDFTFQLRLSSPSTLMFLNVLFLFLFLYSTLNSHSPSLRTPFSFFIVDPGWRVRPNSRPSLTHGESRPTCERWLSASLGHFHRTTIRRSRLRGW